jgi:hypothetical protein
VGHYHHRCRNRIKRPWKQSSPKWKAPKIAKSRIS